MRNTIRWRIAIPYVLLIVAFMGGLAFYLSNFVRSSFEDNWRTNLLASADPQLLAGRGTITVNVASSAPLGVGTFTLFSYQSIVGTFPTVPVITGAGLAQNTYAYITTGISSVILHVVAADMWTLKANGNWSVPKKPARLSPRMKSAVPMSTNMTDISLETLSIAGMNRKNITLVPRNQ